jgi:hypothetical protein
LAEPTAWLCIAAVSAATRPAPFVDVNADPAAYREQARWLIAEAAKLPATQASWLLETAARFNELADLAGQGG